MSARQAAFGLALALVAAVAPAAAAQAGDGSRDVQARAALARASELRRGLRAVRGDARETLRARVLEAYREVRERFPDQTLLVAEASFRAGELLRAAGVGAEAREEFEQAWKHGAGTGWRARAGLELGHLARRAERHEQALRRYRAVLSDPGSPPGRRDEAALWAGRCCAELDRDDEARALWERVATQATDPCDRVTAHDELALAWIAAGDLEAAAGELERCRSAVRERAAEETPLGARVRSALLRMRAIGRLRDAIARRRGGVVIER